MRSALPILVTMALAGCGSNEPAWALDFVFVSPDGSSGLTGSQTWQVYGEKWQKGFKEKHYVCSVLATFEGTAIPADCPDCVAAFEVVLEITDSDCPDALTSDERFVSVQRLGFGPLGEAGPHPGQSSVGYIDYGAGWEVHGWAYPDALDQGESPGSDVWDGNEPFAMAPSFAWMLGPDATTAPVSRLAIEGATPPVP